MKKQCPVIVTFFIFILLQASAGLLLSHKDIVTGKGAGSGNDALIHCFDPAGGAPMVDFYAYGYQNYGTELAAGDIDGNGVDEIITAPGCGKKYTPLVRCFREDGRPMAAFLAYGFKNWGANVACGDLDGDGMDEILTAPGPGPQLGGVIRGFKYEDGEIVPMNLHVHTGGKYGARVACGDFDGDFYDEFLTTGGPGPGQNSGFQGWDYDGGPDTEKIDWLSGTAFGSPNFGANIGAGDIDWDLIDEIFVGPGPGPAYGAIVKVYDPVPELYTISDITRFRAYGTGKYGLFAAAANVDEDGYGEIITGPGPSPAFGSHVRGFNYDGNEISAMKDPNFLAYGPAVKYGVHVAAGNMEGRSYKIIDLGNLSAYGINQDGDVTGQTFINNGMYPFLWQDLNGNDQCEEVEVIDLGKPQGSEYAYGIAVNQHDQVTGNALFEGGTTAGKKSGLMREWQNPPCGQRHREFSMEEYYYQAFFWKDLNQNGQSDPGEMIDISTPGNEETYVYDMNDNGWVAGSITLVSPETMHAIIWHKDHGIVDLGTLIGAHGFSIALGMNNKGAIGQVVGVSSSEGGFRAFLWEDLNGNGQSDEGEMENLGTLGGRFSEGRRINDHEWVTGIASTEDDTRYIYIWHRDLGMKPIGLLPNFDYGYPQRINNSTEIVGYAYDVDPEPFEYLPFIWDNGDLTDFNFYLPPEADDWTIRRVVDINDAGYILGDGSKNNYSRSLLLKPVQ